MLTYKEYGMQRAAAKQRGVEFNLTFDEWHDWWLNTGHADERGKGKGTYCMARLNDAGAYELGNIKCLSFEDNVKEGHRTASKTLRSTRCWITRRAKMINSCVTL